MYKRLVQELEIAQTLLQYKTKKDFCDLTLNKTLNVDRNCADMNMIL